MTHKIIESADGTKLIVFSDGRKTVAIPSKDSKLTVCVSSQIGCGMKCSFCRAGKFVRNLTSSEIISQVSVASSLGSVTAVVVMGMGEPMLNFSAVDTALKEIHSKFSISYKHITLSTCGIHLDKLVDAPYHVAVSLHSAFDSKRSSFMPGSAPVSDVVSFTKEYTRGRKSGLMIEYTLIAGENDSDSDLDNLLSYDWPLKTNFNLIEFNDFGSFKRSNCMHEWKEAIISKGYKCFIRHSRGSDIEAACGMLDRG